jgi:BASS family bile acid:Na+ symporter
LKTLEAVNRFVNRYLTVFVLISVALSLLVPGPFTAMGHMTLGSIHFGSYSFTLSLTSFMLMIIMLGAGASISIKEILGVIHRPLDLAAGIAAKYVIMAAGAWITARILRMNDQLAFGLILLGAMPPGTGAAVLVALAGGEISFGVALCVLCTFLAPVISPLLTLLLGGARVDVDLISMVINITIIVLIPITAGIILRSTFQERLQGFRRVLTTFSLLSVMLIICNSTAPNKDVILSVEALIVILALTVNFVIAAAGVTLVTRLLRMSRPRAKAAILVSCEQNNALAVGIAAGFADTAPAVAIPPIIAVALNFALAAVLTGLLTDKKKDKTP